MSEHDSSNNHHRIELLPVITLLTRGCDDDDNNNSSTNNEYSRTTGDYHNNDRRTKNDPLLLREAATLLSNQWKRGGTPQDYYEKITSNGDMNCLPASYLLVMYSSNKNNIIETINDGTSSSSITDEKEPTKQQSSIEPIVLLGHGRLIECYESLAGSAAAATYIVIKEQYRGKKYGNVLMTLLEQQAVALGYHYMYLWTQTAIDFYRKLNYVVTERVSLYRACLKPLNNDQVTKLEDMLRTKFEKLLINKSNNNNNGTNEIFLKTKYTETILLPPLENDSLLDTTKENNATSEDVWLRKRLVEHDVNTIKNVPLSERLDEIRDGIIAYHNRKIKKQQQQKQQRVSPGQQYSSSSWHYYITNVPWQQQVGPSCGLAALRMIRDYYYSTSNSDDNEKNSTEQQQQQQQRKFPSLLMAAKNAGYTEDGEVFDATNLLQLAQSNDCFGESTTTGDSATGDDNNNTSFVECTMCSFQQLTPYDIVTTLRNNNGLYIVPYDTNKFTKLPCNNTGLTAHYGIIVGIVIATTTMNTGCTNNQDDDGGGDESQKIISLQPLTEQDVSYLQGNSEVDLDDILLLVQHGLTSKLSIASYNEFFISNQQLTTYDHIKYKDVTKLDLLDRIIEFSKNNESNRLK